jgi:hypothetical protein
MFQKKFKNTKYKYKIQIQNTNTKYKYKIQIQNTNTKYKYKNKIYKNIKKLIFIYIFLIYKPLKLSYGTRKVSI